MKHAYLIMAHGNFEQLQFLVYLLDCKQNDIFIHIDKKTEICDLSLKTKYSAVTIFQKYKIYWGTYSQVQCELFLLRQAIHGGYDYYHLLLGSDMPLKNMKMINSFFEKNNGIEFVTVVSPGQYNAEVVRRAKYVIKNERYIAKQFKFVNSADELFLQTLLRDSPYKNRLCNGIYSNLRFVKFSEDNRSSHPYLIDKNLFEIAKQSGCLFARKFDFDKFPEVKNSINDIFDDDL